MQRNSDKQTADATGGKHDYEVRSIIGCQNLNCEGHKTDPYYADHDYNSQHIARNQEGYNAGQTQLGTGQTYDELATNNIKKDPVGATLASAGMVGLGIATAGGLPAISMMGTGAAIGGGVNAGAQYLLSGSVDWKDVVIGGVTGAATIGAPFVPGLLVNTGGALMRSTLKGENPNGNMAGAAIGTTVGYPIGARVESTLNRTLNPWYRSDWTELGLGISAFVPKSPIPSIFGTFWSGGIQEFTGDSTKQHIQGKK